jgi:hypothetical protein
MVFNATFNNISVFSYIVVVSCIGGGNWRQEKTFDLSQVTDKLYHMLYQVHLAWAGFEITLSVDRH